MTAPSPSPAQIAHQFLGDMQRLDLDSALKRVSDSCEYVNPPPLPLVHGPAGIRSVLEPFFAPTLDNEFKLLREAVSGPLVFLERLDRHRLADKWVELPVTGVLEVHDGKITYWHDYFDAANILSQWHAA